jgi:predicted negative regulator of RcsB-dependent stress response
LTEYMTEQEQIELLKNWIKQYSLVIIAGVAIAMLAITSWRYWQQREYKINSHASAVYDEVLTMRAQNNLQATEIQADKLFTHYPKTIYSEMAALMLARDAVQNNNYPLAEKNLQWAMDHSHAKALTEIIRIRLARVYLAENRPADTLHLLKTTDDASFNGFINEVRGDAYLALNQKDQASAAYNEALKALPNADVLRPLLQMKADNLATSAH